MLIQRKTAFYMTHLVVLCAQALFTLALILSKPSEVKSAVFLGYSLEKMLLLSIPLGVFLSGILLVKFYRSHTPQLKSLDAKLGRFFRSRAANITNVVFLFVILLCCYLIASWIRNSFFILAPHYDTYIVELVFERYKFYLQQLVPVLYLALGLCLQAIIFIFGYRSDFRSWINQLRSQGIYPILGVYGIFLILWGLLNWGSSKLEPDITGYSWHPLGAPILDTDVVLVFLIGIVLMGLGAVVKGNNFGRKSRPPTDDDQRDQYIDLSISALVWLVAGLIWLSSPVGSNWFIAEPSYPNYEYYPSSDALKYDISAQNMLLGGDLLYYGKLLHFKPVYSAFLALLHSIAGPGFESVSMLQSAIFGVFPALVYLLTKRLHSRLAGILAAMLVIFREANAMELTSDITVSHSRQLMTETPAAIGILLILYTFYIWSQKPNKFYWLPVLIGVAIATFMQVRNELLLLLPLVLVFQALFYFRMPRYWINTAIFMVLGFTAIFALWQLRGMYYSGQSFLNASRVSAALRDGEVRSSNTEPELQARDRIQKIASHFVHNQKQAFLIFPVAFRPVDSLINYSESKKSSFFWKDCCSAKNYIDRLHQLWEWNKRYSQIPQESLPAVFTTLFFIAVGIIRSKEKLGARALLPLFVMLAFYLLFSVFRMSGGRRVQLVDWVWIVYYSIGLAQFAEWVFYFIFSARASDWLVGVKNAPGRGRYEGFEKPEPSQMAWRPVFTAGLVGLLLGSLVPLVELVIPSKFSEESQQTSINAALALDNEGLLKEFLGQNGVVWEGRAFYPQYVSADQIDRDLDKVLPGKDGYLGFSLAGPNSLKMILPLQVNGEFELPNASDVLVFGCPYFSYFEALAVYVIAEDSMIYRNPLPEKWMCPIPIEE